MMKKLFMLPLLSFSLQAQVIHCGTDTLEQIDTCTIEDKLPMLLGRLHSDLTYTSEAQYNAPDPCDPLTVDIEETEEVEVCPVWNPKLDTYYYEEQEYDEAGVPEISFYERLVMLSKPLESVFSAELLVWALEKKVIVNWRLRVAALTRLRRSSVKCSISQPNLALLKESLYATIDDVRVDCLESKSAMLDMEDAHRVMKDKRRKDRAFGDDLVEETLLLLPDTMGPLDKLTLLDYLAKIQRLLQLGDIDGAQVLITSTPVTALFSQPLKDFLLGKILIYLGA